MRGLNKRPPRPTPPPSKLLEKCKAPGGLNRGFMVPFERMRNVNTTLKNGDEFFFSAQRKNAKRKTAGPACLATRHGKGELLLNREKDDA